MKVGDVMESARKLLRDTMEQKKWRAPQVAEALGCSDDVVRRWLRGERRMQLEDVIRLAEISGADLNATFGLRAAGQDLPARDIQTLIEEGIQTTLGKALVAALQAVGTPQPRQSEMTSEPTQFEGRRRRRSAGG